MHKMRWLFLIAGLALVTNVRAVTPYAVMGFTDLWFDRGQTALTDAAVDRVRGVFAKAETCGPRWQANTRVHITSGALNPQASPDTAEFIERAKTLQGFATSYGFEQKQIHLKIDPLAHSVSGDMRRNGAPHEHYIRVFIHCAPH
jgi:hypothetical protein